ncbi:MAG: glycosyltransferase, partial [Flavobacterium sp.]
VKLILVGDGVLLEPNKKLVSELNLESRVLFLGNRYDIPQLISYCDVVLLSSVWEGFGLAAVEGMASKKAVIASNIEGIKDIVKDYGLLFEKGNAEELAKLITELKQNEELYASVSLSCYKRSQDFDINKMIESYVSIYQLLLQ